MLRMHTLFIAAVMMTVSMTSTATEETSVSGGGTKIELDNKSGGAAIGPADAGDESPDQNTTAEKPSVVVPKQKRRRHTTVKAVPNEAAAHTPVKTENRAASFSAPDLQHAAAGQYSMFFGRVGVMIDNIPMAFGPSLVLEGGMLTPSWFDHVSLGFEVGYGYVPRSVTYGHNRVTFGINLESGHTYNEHHSLLLGISYAWAYDPSAPAFDKSSTFNAVGLMGGWGYHFTPKMLFSLGLKILAVQSSWSNGLWGLGASPTVGIRYQF